ncbi:DNA gyrase inhibitor YacG [Bartonella senegalensis]|uniref:DNA gyrase inhibitor YacG n=1 Tax=Bartonella senegalensis TaxID=1468418 RepID=UPI000556FAB5|nr:DNA gyrase inhibitor YacG [Bartonella senegalensis]
MKQNKKPIKGGEKNQQEKAEQTLSKVCEQVKKTHQMQSEPNSTQTDVSLIRPAHPCPICGQMAQQNAYPFCSTRCRAIDLNRWLSGSYILPPPPQKTDEEE